MLSLLKIRLSLRQTDKLQSFENVVLAIYVHAIIKLVSFKNTFFDHWLADCPTAQGPYKFETALWSFLEIWRTAQKWYLSPGVYPSRKVARSVHVLLIPDRGRMSASSGFKEPVFLSLKLSSFFGTRISCPCKVEQMEVTARGNEIRMLVASCLHAYFEICIYLNTAEW